MKIIKISKAGEVAGNAPPDVSIEFSGAPPEFQGDFYKGANDYYEQQAMELGSTLIETLPGGTLDRLIVFLLRQKASYFRVPYVKPQDLFGENKMREVNYTIAEETTEFILLRDLGPHDKYFTITNGAEFVVMELAERLNGRRLEYIDSCGDRDQILVRDGKFAGFAPC